MNNPTTINARAIRRIACLLLALLMTTIGLPVIFQSQHAQAAYLTSRSIKMSDSANSGNGAGTAPGNGTNVTYRVSFTVSNLLASPVHSMVIDFCQESPIIGDTACTAPAGMTAATGFAAVTGGGPVTPAGSAWTLTAAAGQVKLADDNAHGMSVGDSASGVEVFDVTGITNPSAVGTFYARIYTYSNNSWGTYGGAGNVATDNHVDSGGIALTTVRVISITARVQEQLTYCLTSSAPSNWTTAGVNIHTCADPVVAANPPTLILGQGSPTAVLDATRVDTGDIYSQLSTNATHGVVVRLRNSNTSCGGLSADANTTCAIPANNSGSATASQIQSGALSGNANFGMFASNGCADPGTGAGLNSVNTASLVASGAYNQASHRGTFTLCGTTDSDIFYGMDTTSGAPAGSTGVTSTFGSTVMSAPGALFHVDTIYEFAATPALATPAGIYTANMVMIATSTF